MYSSLQKQDAADVPLAHPQDVVKTELLFSPPDQKGVGIEQKQRENKAMTKLPKPIMPADVFAAPHTRQQVGYPANS